jgi:hypothetical protein
MAKIKIYITEDFVCIEKGNSLVVNIFVSGGIHMCTSGTQYPVVGVSLCSPKITFQKWSQGNFMLQNTYPLVDETVSGDVLIIKTLGEVVIHVPSYAWDDLGFFEVEIQ